MSSKNGVVEYSLDASTFVDISGTANSVSVSGGDRKSGEAYTADGDTALIVSGKREPLDVTVKVLYTEAAGTPNAFEDIAAEYEDGTGVCVRWSPTAYDTAGQKRYTTASTAGTAAVGVITSWNYPSVDFASGDPIMVEFTVRTSAILTEDSA
jgi:hypothetical protein